MTREDDRFISFNLTTGEEKVIESPSFEEYFIDNDTVYFLNRDDGFKLYTESEINVEEQAASKLAAYYAEEIETTAGEENGFGTDGAPFTVANGYAFFETVYTFGEAKFDEAFICDLETGEVYLLNEYFGIGPEIEYKEVVK